jgi:ribosomal protein S18 acetylase RimI-like enzyme
VDFTVRGCTLRDVAAILSVATASDIASLGEPDWTEEEVVAVLTAPHQDPARDTWLAHGPDGAPLAWAYVDNPERGPRENVEVYAVDETAFGPLLDLALGRVAERARESGHDAVTLRAGAVASETAYIDALKERGFVFRKRHARMTKVLTGDERRPEGGEPEGGGTVRVMRPDELPRFHEVLQTAFADTADFIATAYADWLAALPPSSWDEWLVAEAGGRIVGVLQSSDQGVERGEGWVKNLAVLREHRKAGIGGALLRAAFAIYAAKGRATAGLGVDLTNPTGAYHLYTGVGMTVAFAADMYERTVEAA